MGGAGVGEAVVGVVVVVVVEELPHQEALQLKPASQAFAFEVSFQVYRKIPEGIRKAMRTTLRGFFNAHKRFERWQLMLGLLCTPNFSA